MSDHALELGQRLQQLRGEPPDASVVLLGFPGAAGGHIPNVLPPPLLFHAPSLLLLHDFVLVPDHVFDLDTDETRSTVPYRMLEKLTREGVVRIVPCAEEEEVYRLLPEVLEQAAVAVSVNLPELGLGQLTPCALVQAVTENRFPDDVPDVVRQPIRFLVRGALDAMFVHGLAESLRCPYAFANNDLLTQAARQRVHGRDPDAAVICRLGVSLSRFSVLLDATGQPADLIPESALIPQRQMKGATRVRETGGDERPYRAPDEGRSMEALDAVLSLRQREPFPEIRALLHEWQTGVSAAKRIGWKLDRLGRRCAKGFERLAPAMHAALEGRGEAASGLLVVIDEPEPSPLTRQLNPAAATAKLVLSHVEIYGETPALSGSTVTRARQSGPSTDE